MIVHPAPVEQEELGLIEGRMPDSKEEWWTAQALWKYEIPFRYQWELFGGTSRRGGLLVDFVVWNPKVTPLLVYGNYWHRNELTGGDRVRLVAIAQYFNLSVDTIPIIWASKSTTKEDIFQFVRQEIAR